MESYQFEILDQYFSVIVTIPHISIKTQSLCIPTYFSVYLKPWEVIIMHKIHKYLKTLLSSRRWHPWHHTIMAGTQSNFWILAHFYQDLCNSCIKSEARTEFSSLFYIYSKICSFQTGLLHGLHLYEVSKTGLGVHCWPRPSLIFEFDRLLTLFRYILH